MVPLVSSILYSIAGFLMWVSISLQWSKILIILSGVNPHLVRPPNFFLIFCSTGFIHKCVLGIYSKDTNKSWEMLGIAEGILYLCVMKLVTNKIGDCIAGLEGRGSLEHVGSPNTIYGFTNNNKLLVQTFYWGVDDLIFGICNPLEILLTSQQLTYTNVS